MTYVNSPWVLLCRGSTGSTTQMSSGVIRQWPSSSLLGSQTHEHTHTRVWIHTWTHTRVDTHMDTHTRIYVHVKSNTPSHPTGSFLYPVAHPPAIPAPPPTSTVVWFPYTGLLNLCVTFRHHSSPFVSSPFVRWWKGVSPTYSSKCVGIEIF